MYVLCFVAVSVFNEPHTSNVKELPEYKPKHNGRLDLNVNNTCTNNIAI